MDFPHGIQLLFLLVAVATYSISTSMPRRKVCVQNDKEVCASCDDNISLHGISEFLEGMNSSVGVDLVLCSSVLTLQDTIQIQDRCSILIQSYINSSQIICEGNYGGFKFVNISDVTLKNFEVVNCGEEYVGTSTNITTRSAFFSFKSSVYFLNSSNVNISNVNITKSDGTGLSVIDTSGNVHIENCTFEENAVRDNRFPGGGGLYVEFSFCTPGNHVCKNNHRNHNSNYTIKNCTFKSNNATVLDARATSYFHSTGTKFQGHGRGGGLCIHLRGQAENNTINVLNCTFVNNSAIWGGGLYISVRDSSLSNIITINHTKLISNSVTLNGGGGMDLGFLFFDHFEPQGNKFFVNFCEFFNNSAEFGGGLFLYSSSSVNYTNLDNVMSFENCEWRQNRARFGAGIDVATNIWDTLKKGYLPSPRFKNCFFESNFIDGNFGHHTMHKVEGKGMFIAVGTDIQFKGNTKFVGNNGTALYLVSSNALFAEGSNVSFEGNTGKAGGAILLLGFASLEINDDSRFYFASNTAREKGGGICQLSYNTNDYLVSRSCFLQYAGERNLTARNISFVFRENRVGSNGDEDASGHSIYMSSLHPCFTGCAELEIEDYGEVFDCIANFNFQDRRQSEVASVGEILTYSAQKVFDVIPGADLEFPVDLRDVLKNSVTALYHVFIMNSSHDSSISTANDYTSGKRVQIFGSPGDTAIIRVGTVDIWEVSFTINVRMMPCPPGYTLSINRNTKNECDCSQNLTVIVNCENSIFRANMRIGNWIGYTNQTHGIGGELQWGYCPIGYCELLTNETNLLLPNSTNAGELDKLVCGNRTGRMCAYCRKNYSTYYHTNYFDCGPYDKCNIGWLLYLVSEFIPITIFFLVIIIFNINFAAGTINGLIFYFQITEVSIQFASSFVPCSLTLSRFREVYTFLVGIFNLKFFYHSDLSFCLWHGAQTLDLFAITYVKIVYSLLLVFIIVFLLRCCSSRKMQQCVPTLFGRKTDVKSSIIHGLSGFLVLCYSESIRVSLLILTPATVRGHKQNIEVVYYNGELEYFSGKHLPYALPALLFLIVLGLGPPLLLISYPLCYRIFGQLKISESKFVNVLCKCFPLERFKPLYDSFQSSFKDEYRFYSGLYFIYRLTILTAFPMTRNITTYYIVILIQFAVMFFLHAIAQPYKKRWHNLLDSFVFAYLLVIHVLILFNYKRATERSNKNYTVSVVCKVLTPLYYLPLCVLIAICVARFIAKLRKLKVRKANIDSNVFENELSESLINRRPTL